MSQSLSCQHSEPTSRPLFHKRRANPRARTSSVFDQLDGEPYDVVREQHVYQASQRHDTAPSKKQSR